MYPDNHKINTAYRNAGCIYFRKVPVKQDQYNLL